MAGAEGWLENVAGTVGYRARSGVRQWGAPKARRVSQPAVGWWLQGRAVGCVSGVLARRAHQGVRVKRTW